MRTSFVYPLAAGLAWALSSGASAAAVTDLERLEALEQEVSLLSW